MAAPAPLATHPARGSAAGLMATPGSDYADLMRRVRTAGLRDRRLGYYLRKIAVTGGLLAAAWTGFVLLGDSWWQVAVAAFLAVVFIQIGFIGHDAGHRQIPLQAGQLPARRW
jgi:fatty acid desaturase